MGGSGRVRDLREAMSLQNEAGAGLATAVQIFANGSTRSAQVAHLDTLLQAWAATEADSRFHLEPTGSETRRFQVTGSTDAALEAKLNRIIPILEVFNGGTVDAAGWRSVTTTVGGQAIKTYTIAAAQAEPDAQQLSGLERLGLRRLGAADAPRSPTWTASSS